MRTTYFKAVHIQLYNDLADLVEMQIANGSKILKKKNQKSISCNDLRINHHCPAWGNRGSQIVHDDDHDL